MEKEKKGNNSKKIIALALALVLLIGGTYAYLSLTLKGTKTTRIESGTLAMTIEGENSGISMVSTAPMSDSEATTSLTGEGKEYIFTLKNTGSVPSVYTVYLDNQGINAEEEFGIDKKFIKCKLEGTVKNSDGSAATSSENVARNVSFTTTLDKLLETGSQNAILDSSSTTGNLEAGQYIKYNLKLWISDAAGQSDLEQVARDEYGNVASGATRKVAAYSGTLRVEATQVGIENDAAYGDTTPSTVTE